ncbi:MFS general substrate transporter [Microthyrium microscopicum]|uniref:MFS general substrate transporter n=1 Tax=Microthyrium microscopicum TaxID=703497 RepID=A0A6A6UCS9_9PEZI|nr:MFS general substrate transporter [Microthyrium microscopicum]
MEWIRDAPVGQAIRYLTKNKVLQYPEEKPDFECPHTYSNKSAMDTPFSEPSPSVSGDAEKVDKEPVEEAETNSSEPTDLEKRVTVPAEGPHLEEMHTQRTQRGQIERVGSRTALSRSSSQRDLEQQLSLAIAEKGPSRPIVPDRLDDGTILVDWYTTDDPENPQNWKLSKKLWVTLIICLYTTAVYMGSSIYAPSEQGIIEQFGVNVQLASMGLSMYVLAYGLGPMLWSPLSEIPSIGRNPPYVFTFAIFVILCVPTALVNNFPGLVVLRFLQGFFGSPCLATGGASLQDMYSLLYLPFAVCLWALAATCGPAFGPIISGFSVAAENWRWSMWEMLWLAGPVFIAMFFFLPETNPSTILLHRARRLRAATGNQNLKAQSEIDQANMSISALILENLYRPLQMMFLDPAVGFTALYTALIYGIYYSFFEAFPLVYNDIYGFNLGESGLAFLSITVGVIIAIATYWSWLYWYVVPDMKANGIGAPERRLIPALVVTWFCPAGLFIFGWTSREDIHWIVPTIGITIFTVGIFIVIQCIFVFLPLTYPQYAASLFAGNDFVRSSLATGAIHFSRPLFGNLGVDRGVSLLGGLIVGCCIGLYALWYYGSTLRQRSKFSAK